TPSQSVALSGVAQQTVLAFRLTFCLDRNVPPVDDVTSLTAVGGNAYHGTAFTTTHWSVVLEAQGPTPAAQAALEKLCSTYWRPIYGFVRRQGVGPEEAKDVTQGFFALLLERRDLNTVRFGTSADRIRRSQGVTARQ